MATDINQVVLVGRLTRDCEVRMTQGNEQVMRFSIAVNRARRSGDGWTDEASFIDCVLWSRQTEALRPYMTKGRQVAVTGMLHQSRWEQDGLSRSKLEVYVNQVQLLAESRAEERTNSPAPSSGYRKPSGNTALAGGMQGFAGPETFDDSDIPF